ncbi:hypothetical protein AYO44_09760 [Planctomycetaceae bacterium SCGC AG-212-F19]|nr:hypothetical protein AYO44_09760 [Planctomycetaceae bacterium SCGC AG-212-F19]
MPQSRLPAEAADDTRLRVTVVVDPQAGPVAPRTDGHLPPLDGLRGIAILLVMLYHFVDQLGIGGSTPLPAGERLGITVSGAGWVGVDLFFVLSGFLITGILCRTRDAGNYFRSFFMRRLLRIFPLYYGILVGLLVLVPLIAAPSSATYRYLQDHQLWYWTYLTNGLVAWNGGFNGVTAGYFWSLAVEEQFYLLWPFLVWWLSRRAMIRVCIGLFALSALLRIGLLAAHVSATAVYVLPFTRIEPLVVGAFLALAEGGPVDRRSLGRWLGGTAVCSAVILAAVFIHQGRFAFWDPTVAAVSITPLAVLFGWFLFGAVRLATNSPGYRMLTHPFFLSFGKLSYAVYIFHPIAAALVKEHVLNPLRHASAGGSILLPLVGYLVAATVVSWLMAWLSWHLLEKHFLAMKKYFPAGGKMDDRGNDPEIYREEPGLAPRALTEPDSWIGSPRLLVDPLIQAPARREIGGHEAEQHRHDD